MNCVHSGGDARCRLQLAGALFCVCEVNVCHLAGQVYPTSRTFVSCMSSMACV